MALVLSRKEGETVFIGDEVTVKVVEIRGDKVRLAFEAPKNVEIHREEVLSRIRHQVHEALANGELSDLETDYDYAENQARTMP